MIISEKIINRFVDPDCELCEGTGVTISGDGLDEAYCLCVVENRKEYEGEELFDNKYQSNEA